MYEISKCINASVMLLRHPSLLHFKSTEKNSFRSNVLQGVSFPIAALLWALCWLLQSLPSRHCSASWSLQLSGHWAFSLSHLTLAYSFFKSWIKRLSSKFVWVFKKLTFHIIPKTAKHFHIYSFINVIYKLQNVIKKKSIKLWNWTFWVGKIPWRREWLHAPVFLPGEFHKQRSLAVYSPWGQKDSDMT